MRENIACPNQTWRRLLKDKTTVSAMYNLFMLCHMTIKLFMTFSFLFCVKILQISFSSVVFPTLISTYLGQAAYLMKFPENVGNTFYKSVPGKFLVLVLEYLITNIICITEELTVL